MIEQIKDKNVYIAGPMTGIEDYNRRAFYKAHFAIGFYCKGVLNPASLPTTLAGHDVYMSICLPMVDAADAMILLPGWESSKGAKLEKMRAENNGIPVYTFEHGKKGKPPILNMLPGLSVN